MIHVPRRIAIIGAGMTGLATAWFLKQKTAPPEITIFEARDRAGGNVWSERLQGFLVEFGPNGFLDNKPTTLHLCQQLGLHEQLIVASEGARKNRYVFWNERLQKLPNSLSSFLRSPLLSWKSKWKLVTEKYRRTRPPDTEESIDAFARRRTTAEIASILADAMVTGIHGGDYRRLSLPAAFPRLAQYEADHGSVLGGVAANRKKRRAEAKATGQPPPEAARMWGLRDGLRVLIETLADQLKSVLQLSRPIKKLRRDDAGWWLDADREKQGPYDAVLLTTPAFAQAELLWEVSPALAEELATIVYNPIAVVALGFNTQPTRFPIDGFGYLVPQSLQRDVLGVQWCSSIYEGRCKPGQALWRVLCGGDARPEVVTWSDEKLCEAALSEVDRATPLTAAPVFQKVIRWPRAIPQYHLGHLARCTRIDALRNECPGLYLGGNAFGGVGLNDCVESAERFASLLTQL